MPTNENLSIGNRRGAEDDEHHLCQHRGGAGQVPGPL